MAKLKGFFLVCALCCMPSAHVLFAGGRADDAEKTAINNEWSLCITAIDNSGLPDTHKNAGDVIIRNLVELLDSVNYRLRISPEYAYYEGYAWQQSKNTVARNIANKQNERALLLYRGEPGWRYRRNLKRIDDDIAKLMESFAEIESEKPLINTVPEFRLSQSNLSGNFPVPPKPGGEHRFCQSQRADAFLAGEIREFHGRYYIRLQLYALYSHSFIFEDDIIFSLDDAGGAVEEIAARLTSVLSGNRPAAVMVQAEPPESQVIINRNYAGRGTVQTREYPPGKITIAVAAEGYSPQTVETELAAGELAEVSVNLSPLVYSDVNVSAVSNFPPLLYMGALYVGEPPLTLRLPIDSLVYIVTETKGGEEAKVVFITPDMPGESLDISLRTKILPFGEKRVNKARTRHYWAWGGTWIAGITAWITNGIFTGRNAVLAQSSSQEFYDATQTLYYVSTGAVVVLGAVAIYELVQMSRYVYTAASGATPIARQERAKK